MISSERVHNGPNLPIKKPHHDFRRLVILGPESSWIEIVDEGDVEVLHLRHEFLSGYRVGPYIQVVEVVGMEYYLSKKKT